MEQTNAQTVLSTLGGRIIIDLPAKVVKRHLKCCAAVQDATREEMRASHWNGDRVPLAPAPITERVNRRTTRVHLTADQLFHLFSDVYTRISLRIIPDRASERTVKIIHDNVPDLLDRINHRPRR